MGIATIGGIILGLVVVCVTFALTSLVGPSADIATIGMVLGGCAVGGVASFLVSHMLGLPRIAARVHSALVRTTIGGFIDRHGVGASVVCGVGALVAMGVVIRDPGGIVGVPAIAVLASVCGAVVVNMWARQVAASGDRTIAPDFGGPRSLHTQTQGQDGYKRAA